MGWGAIASIGAALIGRKSSKSAQNAQSNSDAEAIAEQRRQYDLTRSDSAPWREAGSAGISRLSHLLGLKQSGDTSDYGALNKKFSISDFMDDPIIKLSYQSGLDLGTQAIERMTASRGSRNSGATLKALSRFGTDYTGQKSGESYNRFYGDQDRTFNRLSGVSGAGQVSTTALGGVGSATSTNIGNLLSAGGNARGAAAIARGNLYSGAVQNIGDWYNRNKMLDRVLGSGTRTSYGSSDDSDFDTFNVPGLTYGR